MPFRPLIKKETKKLSALLVHFRFVAFGIKAENLEDPDIFPDMVDSATGYLKGQVLVIGQGHTTKKGFLRSMDVQIGDQILFADASRLNYDNAMALHWYQKIYKKDNGKTYTEVPYYIASQLKTLGKYKDAKKYFDKYYKKQNKSKDKTKKQLAQKAKQETEACDMAQILVKNPVDVKVLHLDSAVNSKVSEYAPFEYDSTLYFSSLRDKWRRLQ